MEATNELSPPVPQRAVLLGGDVLVFLAFAIIGRRAHAMGSALSDVAGTTFPFLVGWLLAAGVTRAYSEQGSASPGRAAGRAALTWVVGFPLGLLIRELFLGRASHWSFAAVGGGFTLMLLVGWRAMYGHLVARRRATRARNGR